MLEVFAVSPVKIGLVGYQYGVAYSPMTSEVIDLTYGMTRIAIARHTWKRNVATDYH